MREGYVCEAYAHKARSPFGPALCVSIRMHVVHIVHPFTHRRPSHTCVAYIAHRSHIIDGSDVPYGCIIIINDTKSILVHDSVAPWIQAFSLVVYPRILLPYLLTCIKGDRIIFHVGYLNRRHSSISEERLYTRCTERVYDIFLVCMSSCITKPDGIYESHQPPNGVEPIPPPY